MAVDSVRNLVSKGRVVFGERSAGIPGRIWIRGLISFDSPFFGLQSGAITGTVTRQLSKAKEYYQVYIIASLSHIIFRVIIEHRLLDPTSHLKPHQLTHLPNGQELQL